MICVKRCKFFPTPISISEINTFVEGKNIAGVETNDNYGQPVLIIYWEEFIKEPSKKKVK